MPHYPRPSYGPNPFEACIDVFKAFFTKNPESANTAALNSPANSWFVTMGVYAIVIALFTTVMVNRIMDLIMALMFGFMGPFGGFGADILDINYAQIFFTSLLTSVITFFIYAGAVKLVFTIYKIDLPFMKVADLVGASFIPYILVFAASILFLFVSFYVVFILMVVGATASSVLLYRGMQDVAGERTSIMWGFFGMIGALMTLLVFATAVMM